jgi:hypothetical protein
VKSVITRAKRSYTVSVEGEKIADRKKNWHELKAYKAFGQYVTSWWDVEISGP